MLQWEVAKVKQLLNSNMTLTVLNLHQKTPKGATTKIQPISSSSIKLLYLIVSDVQPRQDIYSRHPSSKPDAMSENNTHTTFKGCVVEVNYFHRKRH